MPDTAAGRTHCGDLGFVPHHRETWPWRLARTRVAIEPMRSSTPIPAGTTVKIVMASRFGDLGITRDLDADYGYEARVMPDDLEPIWEVPPCLTSTS